MVSAWLSLQGTKIVHAIINPAEPGFFAALPDAFSYCTGSKPSDVVRMDLGD